MYSGRWKCRSRQPLAGCSDSGMSWSYGYHDHRTVRTDQSVNTSRGYPTPISSGPIRYASSGPIEYPSIQPNGIGLGDTQRREEQHQRDVEFVEARTRDGEEERRRMYEDAYQRVMGEYDGALNTRATRDRLASEVHSMTELYEAHTHTHSGGTTIRSTVSPTSGENIPESIEEERETFGDRLRRYMSFGRTG